MFVVCVRVCLRATVFVCAVCEQWATWDGIRKFEAEKHDYLQGQIGNPEGPEKPNKKYYDPRMSLRAAEESMANRLVKAAEDLKCIKVL